MIVIFKEGNEIKVRPAYIGFIKNNYIRRTMMILCSPIVCSIVIALNLVRSVLIFIGLLLRSVWLPIASIKPGMKKLWNQPRKKVNS